MFSGTVLNFALANNFGGSPPPPPSLLMAARAAAPGHHPLRDETLDVIHSLESDVLLWQIKKKVKAEISKARFSARDLPRAVPAIMDDLGLNVQLRNAVHEVLLQKQRNERAAAAEPVPAPVPTPMPQHQRQGGAGGATGKGGARGASGAGRSSTSTSTSSSSSNGGSGGGSVVMLCSSSSSTVPSSLTAGAGAAGTAAGAAVDPAQLPARVPTELDCVAEAKRQWEEGICEELNSMASERRRPLARQRSPAEQGVSASSAAANGEWVAFAAAASAEAASSHQGPARFLFDSEDFLEAVISIPSSNHSQAASGGWLWGLVQLQLRTPTSSAFREMFADLSPAVAQVGVDDVVGSCGGGGGGGGGGDSQQQQAAVYAEKFLTERISRAERTVSGGSRITCQSLVRAGAPNSLRKELWCKVLNVRRTEKAALYLDSLLRHYRHYDLLVDELIHLDVQNTVNDDTFFPFEEVLAQVVCAFSRDPWVLKQSAVRPHTDMTGVTTDGEGVGAIPPCGLQPFRGLASYAAPLCYLSTDPTTVFLLFRKMFVTHWCWLNTLTSRKPGIVSLCRTFEQILQNAEPDLFFHLNDIGVPPIRIAFPWIHLAFVG